MSTIREYAEQLSDVYLRMEDCKAEAAAIIEAAKDADIDVKALRKVAKELTMPSDKLAQRFDDEAQIDMFRDEVGLLARKGLIEPLREAAE